MNWTTPDDLKMQLARRWQRGELLRARVACRVDTAGQAETVSRSTDCTNEQDAGPDGGIRFPLRLALRGPSPAELTGRFDAVRAWAADLAAMPHVRLVWREVRHRVHGAQRLPSEAWIDTLDDALALLNRRRDAAQFAQLADMTRDTMPALLAWLAKRPLQALELSAPWQRLLAVTRWMAAHPNPGIYLRQVDLPGVHSKFIEAHRAVLAEWFDLVLPQSAIDTSATGISQFARRYGFLEKPVRIRFRVLDPDLVTLSGLNGAMPDIALDADSFSRLDMPVSRVFITENETNFLAFPATPRALVVFGAGYGWEALGKAQWLAGCELHYWGDIDTHGFAILDGLRRRFPHAKSFLMDRATLLAHEALWGDEREQALQDLPLLTAEERALFDDLRDNRIRQHLRLEQEHVGFSWVAQHLARIADSP